ncbi:MAG: phosphodiester glycosidase family protein, partial [Eubacteriales bacterium]|nr:phosphodiester glycosidase family protein [Eubacteriales bacterium]
GRNITPDTPGFSTSEVASILKSLGCVDAINLDGGGSSCMLINGKETIKPSGNGVQRSLVTAIAIQ